MMVLVACSFFCGLLMPAVASVAAVFFVSSLAIVAILVFSVLYHSDWETILFGWLACVVALQVGYATSLGGIAAYRRHMTRQKAVADQPAEPLDRTRPARIRDPQG